jgi:hypothetical protein
MAEVPDYPAEAALKNLQPPAPAPPIHVDSQGAANATAVAVTAVASPAVAAHHTIQTTLLALARQIRRPQAYLGYSAFILMAFLKKCAPVVLEGDTFIDLLDVFAPWGKEYCTKPLSAAAVPCALVPQPGGSVQLAPISTEHPLVQTSHFVVGMKIPECQVVEGSCKFETLYAMLGVAILSTVLDGDCAVDAMLHMLCIPSAVASRNDLRIELSDYLIARIHEPWLHDVMVACQELEGADVSLYRSGDCHIIATPTAPAPAVADLAVAAAEQQDDVTPDEETFAALRWASKLDDDCCVLNLIRSLPKEVLGEQVSLYRRRDATAVAAAAQERPKLRLAPRPRLRTRMLVGHRFHAYCRNHDIALDVRLPHGAMKTFIADNLELTQKMPLTAKTLRAWHGLWRRSCSGVVAAVADIPAVTPYQHKSLLRSRAPQQACARHHAPGQGRHPKAQCVRQALYEWFTGIRYAIDWRELIAENRSRGRRHLARFPRSILKLKVQQLLQDYTYACLLNGVPVQSVKCNSWWFRRWEDDYGLSMRMANRKYAVSRAVVKERMEIFWIVLFRLRYFIFLVFGYDPLILNFDQSPFHHNETGSQNKPTLAIRGSTVPVVEGNNDVKSRWTVNITTQSRFNAVAGDQMPAAECMFKAQKDGTTEPRLQAFHRSRGLPQWFTVTVGPKGSYREYDIIAWMQKHLEPWSPGRDWRIYLCDDYSAHKTKNVWNLCWSRGYIRHVHGGGCTPYAQTCDTDCNEHVRREYGKKETRVLLDKMRCGQVVPKLTHEECMLLMFEVLSDPAVHARASQGYKYVGQSIDLHGGEDEMVCREAGTFWRETTTDKFPSMRSKIDAELAVVADEWYSIPKGITWCERDVLRLITPYPRRPKVDRVLERLGEDFYHDDVHSLNDVDDTEAAAVAEGVTQDPDSDSDEDNEDDAPADHGLAAVAGEGAEGAASAEPDDSRMVSAPVNEQEADLLHTVRATIAGLEATSEHLRSMGAVSSVQKIEFELANERRKARRLCSESPAVAVAFSRLRRAEEQERLKNDRIADEHKQRTREAAKTLADRDAAVAGLRETKKQIQVVESIVACRHAIKTFTLQALGEGGAKAGAAKARKNRFEVLDRLSRIRAGLSAGQWNDWTWFKEAWDAQMVLDHGASWASVFAKLMQSVLEDERSNAFSTLVYLETCRVLQGTAALHVPGR